MLLVNCTIKENFPIEAVIDSDANVNIIKKRYINKMNLAFNENDIGIKLEECNSSISILGKIELL